MSGRNYRTMGTPHVLLQLASDFDPTKAKVFFVDRDGVETEMSGIISLNYEAAITGPSEWPEITMTVTGMISIVDEEQPRS